MIPEISSPRLKIIIVRRLRVDGSLGEACGGTVEEPMRESPDERISPNSEGVLSRRPVWVLYNRVPVNKVSAKRRTFWATDHVRLSGT
jgi:hypothetical protein